MACGGHLYVKLANVCSTHVRTSKYGISYVAAWSLDEEPGRLRSRAQDFLLLTYQYIYLNNTRTKTEQQKNKRGKKITTLFCKLSGRCDTSTARATGSVYAYICIYIFISYVPGMHWGLTYALPRLKLMHYIEIETRPIKVYQLTLEAPPRVGIILARWFHCSSLFLLLIRRTSKYSTSRYRSIQVVNAGCFCESNHLGKTIISFNRYASFYCKFQIK